MHTDFILNDQGQVAIGDATLQHAHDLIVFEKGWHKFHPYIGAGLQAHLADERSGAVLKQKIHTELQNDGLSINDLKTTLQNLDSTKLDLQINP